MIVALFTHAGDIRQAQALLRWIKRLGRNNTSPLLLVVDRGTPFDEVMVCQKLALECFADFYITTNSEETKGWPAGPYSLFRAAAEAVHKRFQKPYLVLEPDAIPLTADWCAKIELQYLIAGSLFMGHIYQGTQNFVGETFMSGIGVYPKDTFTRINWSSQPVHWDVHHRSEITPLAVNTPLINHFFGQSDGGVFFVPREMTNRPVNAKDLDWLPKECVLFHRDKSHSLIRLLGQKYFGDVTKAIKVVFPVHAGDVGQAVRHAHWLKKLCQESIWAHTAVIAFDRSTPVGEVTTLRNLLGGCFQRVEEFSYPRAPIPGWPAAANWMFQNVAHKMSGQTHPWLLLEADAVVLRADWLSKLQLAYDTCGQPFFGPYVKHMHHLNGVMVYPPDTPQRIPSAMTCVQQAWDYICSSEMKPNSADASQLLQHCWTILNDEPCEAGGGELPNRMTLEQAHKWIRKDAVVFHRLKSTDLIELCLSGRYQH